MRCCCGCGEAIPFGLRVINKRGARLARDIERVEVLLERGLVSPSASAFHDQATDWLSFLVFAIHARGDPDQYYPGSQGDYVAWLGQVKPFLSASELGRRIRAAGLSGEEAVSQMSRGEFDPWAGVPMPARGPELPESADPQTRL